MGKRTRRCCGALRAGQVAASRPGPPGRRTAAGSPGRSGACCAVRCASWEPPAAAAWLESEACTQLGPLVCELWGGQWELAIACHPAKTNRRSCARSCRRGVGGRDAVMDKLQFAPVQAWCGRKQVIDTQLRMLRCVLWRNGGCMPAAAANQLGPPGLDSDPRLAWGALGMARLGGCSRGRCERWCYRGLTQNARTHVVAGLVLAQHPACQPPRPSGDSIRSMLCTAGWCACVWRCGCAGMLGTAAAQPGADGRFPTLANAILRVFLQHAARTQRRSARCRSRAIAASLRHGVWRCGTARDMRAPVPGAMLHHGRQGPPDSAQQLRGTGFRWVGF